MASRATKMGILGALAGALSFKLSADAQRMQEEAEMRKLQRLEELQMQREAREEERWQQRFGLQTQAARENAQFEHKLGLERIEAQHGLSVEEAERQRQHALMLERERTGGDLRLERERHTLRKEEARFEEELRRTRPPDADGRAPVMVLGDDGVTYELKPGQRLPPGVKPAGGSGITWAPSASKMTPAPGATRGAMRGPAGIPAPKSAQEYANLPSGARYVAPDGTVRVKP